MNTETNRAAAANVDEDRLWTVHDVAEFLQASASWVYKAAEAGTLPCVRIGAMVRFDPTSIRRWALGGNNVRRAHAGRG